MDVKSVQSGVRGLAVMPRRPYRRVSAEDCQGIVSDFRDGLDYVACAERLGVRCTTAYSIVRRYQETGEIELRAPSGGGRPQKVDAEMRCFLVLLIEDLPSITLGEMML